MAKSKVCLVCRAEKELSQAGCGFVGNAQLPARLCEPVGESRSGQFNHPSCPGAPGIGLTISTTKQQLPVTITGPTCILCFLSRWQHASEPGSGMAATSAHLPLSCRRRAPLTCKSDNGHTAIRLPALRSCISSFHPVRPSPLARHGQRDRPWITWETETR